MKKKYTISILTYNRKEILKELIKELSLIKVELEIIVVDNHSTDGTHLMVRSEFPNIKLFRMKKNIGAAARNVGIFFSTGEIIITIDDDLLGLTDEDIIKIGNIFTKEKYIYAICFQVIDYYTEEVSNWCHPYEKNNYCNKKFFTCEITEGAVAYRKDIIAKIGGYPKKFFISNEGADLACRILDCGGNILYDPSIVLKHKHALKSRENWRRYYYDTRNHLWLAVRNYRIIYGTKYVISKVIIMLFYSLRDGFVRYWFKGVIDSIHGIKEIKKDRKKISLKTEARIKKILKNKPGLIYMIKTRIKKRSVEI